MPTLMGTRPLDATVLVELFGSVAGAIVGLTIIGSGHMLYAERDGRPPEAANVHQVVSTVLASVER